MKPLGRKAYGSIPHLPASRIGPGDHFCPVGQQAILTEKVRDRHDRIIVTEKLDGSCVAIARLEGQLLALGRSGYLAQTAPHEHHQHFAAWVRDNEPRFHGIKEGERLCGEWLGLAHGTMYSDLREPFVAFDLMVGTRRLPWEQMIAVSALCELDSAALLSGGPPISVADALAILGDNGYHGAQETVEGAVWRCERRGEFEFAAKYVRHDKVDGKYFEQISGQPPVWLWRPGGRDVQGET